MIMLRLFVKDNTNGVRNIDKGYMAIDRFIHRGCAEVTHWMPLPHPPRVFKKKDDEIPF